MNLLEIIVLAVVLYLALSGFRKGFVKKLASMLSLVLSIVLVSATLPYVNEFLKTSTPVYDVILEQCEKVIVEEAAEVVTGKDSSMVNNVVIGNELLMQLGRIEQMELIENLPLPDYMRDLLLDYNNAEGYRNLAVSTFRDYVTHLIANIIWNVLVFIVAVIIVQLFLWLVITVLNILAHIPVIRFVNRLAGLLLGLVQAVVVIWFFFLVLSMFSATGPGMYLMSMVRESQYLYELYNSNLFMQVVLQTAAIFS